MACAVKKDGRRLGYIKRERGGRAGGRGHCWRASWDEGEAGSGHTGSSGSWRQACVREGRRVSGEGEANPQEYATEEA